jgi:hypothetical protein
MPSSAAYTSLDGGVISISLGSLDADLTEPWSGSIRFLEAKQQFGLQTGPRRTVDDIVMDHPDFRFHESYQYQDGTLRIGWASKRDEYAAELAGGSAAHRVWAAAWEGERFSLFTYFRDLIEARPNMFAWFDPLSIVESPTGISVWPAPGHLVELFASEVTKEIPGLGTLEIRSRRDAISLAPAWDGTSVAGGELYFEDEPPHFLLVGTSAVTVIQPRDEDPSNSERMTMLEDLRVDWQEG